METGLVGAFVIAWSQTEVDGLRAASIETLADGAVWRWRGDTVRVDGPADILQLDEPCGDANLRRRAARSVKRLVGTALGKEPGPHDTALANPLVDSHFVVTDGTRSYTITLIDVASDARPLLMFVNQIPPRDTDLWIVRRSTCSQHRDPMATADAGAVCFTPGTMIKTPDGTRAIETLREGEQVQTRDCGAQDILWIGARRMTGARFFAMPHLRPVRITRSALGFGWPDRDLLVSPDHRILLRGGTARQLFNTPEVLVAARDLIDGAAVRVDLTIKEATYIHLLLGSHQILTANGLEAESFHPANADLATLGSDDRNRLLSQMPILSQDPNLYGSFARRSLSRSEAAILRHEAA